MAASPLSPPSLKLYQYKLVLLGESAVGKSSLVLRFVKQQFLEFQESTIGGRTIAYHLSLFSLVPLSLYSSSLFLWLPHTLPLFGVLRLKSSPNSGSFSFPLPFSLERLSTSRADFFPHSPVFFLSLSLSLLNFSDVFSSLS